MNTVEMHPSRGAGAAYGTVTVVVLLLVCAGATAYAGSGRFLMAAVTTVAGLALTAFLAVVTAALVLPVLTADRGGVRGRTARGATFVATWADVTLDVDEGAAPGTIRLIVEGESLALSARAWSGFPAFVALVAGTPAATGRLTPPALAEVVRLLDGGPGR